MFKTVHNKLFLNFSLATALVFLGFGSVYLIKGNYPLGIFEFSLGLIQLMNIGFLYYKHKDNASYRILVGSVHIMSLIVFITGGLGDTGFLWIEFIPIFTMLILNHKESSLWICVYTFFLLSLIAYNCLIDTFLVYSNIQIFQSVIVYLLFLYLTDNNEKLKAVGRQMLEKQNRELQEMSQTDSLTGLFNRSFINRILNNEFNRFERYNYSFSVIMLDIDHFKKVNDSFGHQTGDCVLVAIAKALKTNTRKTDFICRWGGEEFLIVCPGTTLEPAGILAEKIRKVIESLSFKEGFTVTASFGAAEITESLSVNNLIAESDRLLYESKHMGRNRVSLMESP